MLDSPGLSAGLYMLPLPVGRCPLEVMLTSNYRSYSALPLAKNKAPAGNPLGHVMGGHSGLGCWPTIQLSREVSAHCAGTSLPPGGAIHPLVFFMLCLTLELKQTPMLNGHIR